MNTSMYLTNKLSGDKAKRVILMVIGVLGIIFWGPLALVGFATVTDTSQNSVGFNIAMSVTCLVFAGVGVMLVILSNKTAKKIAMAKQYSYIFCSDNDGVVTADELTAQTGKQLPQFAAEIDDLISKGYLTNCVVQRQPYAVLLSARDNATVNTMNAYAERAMSCPACGGQVSIRPGQQMACPYCGSPIHG